MTEPITLEQLAELDRDIARAELHITDLITDLATARVELGMLRDDAYRAHRAGVTLEQLAELDRDIARAELHITDLITDLATARVELGMLRGEQSRAVAEYNRWAARPLQ